MLKRFKKTFLALLGFFPLLLSSCVFDFIVRPYRVTLNCTKCILPVNEEKQLSFTIEDRFGELKSTEYSYFWSSSNVDVAKVSSTGCVTAVDAGKAKIDLVIHILKNDYTWIESCSFTITDPEPVSITLNKQTAEVQEGKYIQLTANVEHTSHKQVTWKSSNNAIAVDNYGDVIATSYAKAGTKSTITATSLFDPTKSASCVVTVVEPLEIKLDYTIMYYMSGSTLEHDSSKTVLEADIGLISDDIKEILSVKVPDNVKLIIETGGSKKWNLGSEYIVGAESISNRYLQRWEVRDGKIQLIDQGLGANNKIATQDSFESFLKWGLGEYEAEQMGVVISGHGAGVGGCAPDDNNDSDYLSVKEMVNSAMNALSLSEREKFTWLGFDCCMMQCADLASVVSDYFDYMVASQESEYGEGWEHDVYLAELAKNTKIAPTELLPVVASSFVSSLDKIYCENNDPCYQTMSVLDLSKMDNFVTNFNSFVEEVGCSDTKISDYYTYKEAFKYSYNNFGQKEYGLVDFKDFVVHINAVKSSTKTEGVLDALNDLVICNYHCSKYSIKPCGLNAFFPESADAKSRLQILKSDYEGDVTKFDKYQKMCLSFSNFY